MNNLTLGSLFDGSGGFPLAGMLAGITPVWASEVEPFAVRVTTKRLPFMKHYGDITTMNGATVEPVDIITFGSPCQDMSIAGKRAGLDGSRSNLFYEAVRIVKEMRCATNGEYPKWLCWENVPGAFSSNAGEDFRCVLESLCRVKDETVSVPAADKWTTAGEIVGEGYSVAWRVLDAQYWGVPQRRKRIYLVADLTAGRAGQVLFESEGLSGYSAESFRAWQSLAGCASQGSGVPKLCLNDQGCGSPVETSQPQAEKHRPSREARPGAFIEVTDDIAATLRVETHGHPPCVLESAGFCTEHSAKAGNIGYEEETAPTLRAGVVPAAIALDNHPADGRVRLETDDQCQTLTSRMGTGGNNVPLLLNIRSGCDGGGKGP
ncbi:MAG: DNA cytosine methyltransferase, partial [Clostridia bacterium]|nr:DNA cytosine methyltransferase [Clostridia bacterium]